MRIVSVMACSIGLLLAASGRSAEAQFSHVDGVIDRIESQFEENSKLPLTPETARDVNPGMLESSVLRPLRWEQRKSRMRLALLERSVIENQKAQERVLGESLELGQQLGERAVFSEEDLDRAVALEHELKAELEAVEAERNALKDTLIQQQDEMRLGLELQQAKLELETQGRVLKSMEEKVARMRQLHEDGTISNAAMSEVNVELEMQVAKVRRAELEVEKMMGTAAKAMRKPLELATVEVLLLKQQLDALRKRMEPQPQLRESLRRKRELAARHEMLGELQSRLLMQQAEWELEHEYLEQVLKIYSEASAPEAAGTALPGEGSSKEAETDRGN